MSNVCVICISNSLNWSLLMHRDIVQSNTAKAMGSVPMCTRKKT